MQRCMLLVAATAGLLLCVSQAESAVEIVAGYNSSYLEAAFHLPEGSMVSDKKMVGWDTPLTVSASQPGGNQSGATFLATRDGDKATLSVYDVTLFRGGSPEGNMTKIDGTFRLTVDKESTYSLDAQLFTQGSAMANARWLLRGWDDSWSTIYEEQEYNNTLPNGEFTANGQMDGEGGALLEDPVKRLLPGILYSLHFEYVLQDYYPTSTTNAAEATSAWLTLDIAPATSIPEPTTLAIWSALGGLGLMGVRRRKC